MLEILIVLKCELYSIFYKMSLNLSLVSSRAAFKSHSGGYIKQLMAKCDFKETRRNTHWQSSRIVVHVLYVFLSHSGT